jgi:hypothetical protein
MVARLLILLFFVFGVTAAAWAEHPKKVILDGVEYVPKSQTRATNLDKRASDSRIVKLDAGGERGGSLESFAMKGKYGLGFSLDALNFGLGPSGEYWFTDNIAAIAHISALGDFTTIGVKGNYLFDKELKFGQSPYPSKPYVGLGFSKVEGPEGNFGSTKVTTEGSGFQMFAGLFHPAPYIHQNVALRGEFVYSMITVEAEATADTGFGTSQTFKADAGYGGFSIGLGITYYFN